MPKRSCLAIVLAAGDGTRMKSAKPKVLHEIGGLPMLGHVLKTASASGADRIVVVARKGAGGDAVAAAASKMGAAAVYRQDVDSPKRRGPPRRFSPQPPNLPAGSTTFWCSMATRRW